MTGAGRARRSTQGAKVLALAFSLWAIIAAPAPGEDLAGGGSAAPAVAARLAQEELRLLELINRYRLDHGLGPLAWSDRLAAVARAHNEDMVRGGYFGHCSPAGRCLPSRLTAAGYRFDGAAENLAAGQRTPLSVLRSWQGSPAHDRNLLAAPMSEAGIDLDPRAIGGAQRLWTLVLGRPAH